MEKFGEKQNQTSVEIQTLTEFQKFNKFSQNSDACNSMSADFWTKL